MSCWNWNTNNSFSPGNYIATGYKLPHLPQLEHSFRLKQELTKVEKPAGAQVEGNSKLTKWVYCRRTPHRYREMAEVLVSSLSSDVIVSDRRLSSPSVVLQLSWRKEEISTNEGNKLHLSRMIRCRETNDGMIKATIGLIYSHSVLLQNGCVFTSLSITSANIHTHVPASGGFRGELSSYVPCTRSLPWAHAPDVVAVGNTWWCHFWVCLPVSSQLVSLVLLIGEHLTQ